MEGSDTPYVAFEDLSEKTPRSGPRGGKLWQFLCRCCRRSVPTRRTILLNAGQPTKQRHPHNAAANTKYSLVFFVPKVLLEQFRYFFNIYFLLVALSQYCPPFEIGLRFTYIAPLVFVLAVTMAKEGYDDIQRWRTDRAINNETYERLLPSGATVAIRAKDLRVGHVIKVKCDQRVPADLVLLRTHDAGGVVFVRTDQLDGETDWKLRVAVPCTQRLLTDDDLSSAVATLHAAPPSRDIYEFEGDLTLYDEAFESGCIQVRPPPRRRASACPPTMRVPASTAAPPPLGRFPRLLRNCGSPHAARPPGGCQIWTCGSPHAARPPGAARRTR